MEHNTVFAALRRFAQRYSPQATNYPSMPFRKPDVGRVKFGDLHRLTPISPHYGFDRGTPIDRYYIENFLGRDRAEIQGRVLEVGDDTYSRRFGGGRIRQQDVLHVSSESGDTTLVGDISKDGVLPQDAFDCIILTQVLQYVFDLKAAIVHIYRSLRPNGTLLATLPGISKIDRLGGGGECWYWNFSEQTALRIFDLFGTGAIEVEGYGNVFAATAFLHGIAVEEVHASDLDTNDPDYPVLITVKARKAVVGA